MRIVSLLASATEMLAALNALDFLVGRSHECDYPPAVLDLPVLSVVTIDTLASSTQIDSQIKQLARTWSDSRDQALHALSIYSLDVALLQKLRPDVILTQTQCEVCAVSERDVAAAVAQLTGLRPRIVALAPHRLQDVWEDLLRVAEAIGRTDQARQLIQTYQQRLQDLQKRCQQVSQGQLPRVAVLEWLDPLMGAGNWTPELVALAGGQPLFGEPGQHTPWLSWEELRAADPEIIILAPCGFTLQRTLQEIPLLQSHPIWSTLRAVQQDRVYALDGNAYLNRSGPRLVESAELLGVILWGDESEKTVNVQAIQQISC